MRGVGNRIILSIKVEGACVCILLKITVVDILASACLKTVNFLLDACAVGCYCSDGLAVKRDQLPFVVKLDQVVNNICLNVGFLKLRGFFFEQ